MEKAILWAKEAQVIFFDNEALRNSHCLSANDSDASQDHNLN
jgi:hypothetical protein